MKSYILCLLFLCVGFAEAQKDSSAGKTPEVSICGGISYPYIPTNFKDNWSNGVHIGAGYGYSLSQGSFGYTTIFARINYDRYTVNKSGVTKMPELINKKATVDGNPTSGLDITLNVKGTIASSKTSIAPFILFGVGFGFIRQNDITVGGDTTFVIKGERPTSVLWLAGAGLDVPLNESIVIFFEGIYYLLVTDEPPGWQHIPVSAGVRLRF